MSFSSTPPLFSYSLSFPNKQRPKVEKKERKGRSKKLQKDKPNHLS
jgi:hypothetical protein